MELVPYIFFYGRCEEALEFYKRVLGGRYELQRNSDTEMPMPENTDPSFRDKVMHARFEADGLKFFASDGAGGKTIDPDAGNISLAIEFDEAAQGERIFNALSEGGTIKAPLEAAFWGGKFGMFVDRFGIEWMITTP
ncbi:MAG TPA: VOC family protein [Candidatus Baltobacteraceae bacterium]|jgi:PhnB protein|nr:VOC family protein [Candidatus Baltobacteraceae bacterium]